MKTLFWSLIMLIGICSCKDPSLDAVPNVTGNYVAQDFRLSTVPEPYPINGQTISVRITERSRDSVSVAIQATPNGIYSPGQNLTYNKAYVVVNKGAKGVVGSYTIYLDGVVTEDLTNVIMVYTNKTADYIFVPPGYTKGIVVTRLRMV